MLSYGDAPEAVAAGARVIAGMRAEGMPRVHASVHKGVAITREGDYFGGAVNLAARLLAVSGPDELLATLPAIEVQEAPVDARHLHAELIRPDIAQLVELREDARLLGRERGLIGLGRRESERRDHRSQL